MGSCRDQHSRLKPTPAAWPRYGGHAAHRPEPFSRASLEPVFVEVRFRTEIAANPSPSTFTTGANFQEPYQMRVDRSDPLDLVTIDRLSYNISIVRLVKAA
jgi:hypothetical protein